MHVPACDELFVVCLEAEDTQVSDYPVTAVCHTRAAYCSFYFPVYYEDYELELAINSIKNGKFQPRKSNHINKRAFHLHSANATFRFDIPHEKLTPL